MIYLPSSKPPLKDINPLPISMTLLELSPPVVCKSTPLKKKLEKALKITFFLQAKLQKTMDKNKKEPFFTTDVHNFGEGGWSKLCGRPR